MRQKNRLGKGSRKTTRSVGGEGVGEGLNLDLTSFTREKPYYNILIILEKKTNISKCCPLKVFYQHIIL